jgi:hypothetical protein
MVGIEIRHHSLMSKGLTVYVISYAAGADKVSIQKKPKKIVNNQYAPFGSVVEKHSFLKPLEYSSYILLCI